MTNKQLFFAPHPALRHVVNNIMIGHVVTDDLVTNLSFSFPPLSEHSILFYPYDRPSVENIITEQTLFVDKDHDTPFKQSQVQHSAVG